jgi:hypothetical protein
MTNPSLLFLDEPTSGLDSFMADSVIKQLQRLARNGQTIIATLHQPSSSVFPLFDRLILLCRGRVAYQGPAKEAMAFMHICGHPTPEYCNPCDFFLTIISASAKEKLVSKESQEMRVCDEFEFKHQPYQDLKNEVKVVNPTGDLAMVGASSTNASLLSMTWTLMRRSWLTVYRDPLATKARLAQTIIFGIQVGLLFLDLQNSQKDVQGVNGSMFFLLINGMFLAFNSTVIAFPLEKVEIERIPVHLLA